MDIGEGIIEDNYGGIFGDNYEDIVGLALDEEEGKVLRRFVARRGGGA